MPYRHQFAFTIARGAPLALVNDARDATIRIFNYARLARLLSCRAAFAPLAKATPSPRAKDSSTRGGAQAGSGSRHPSDNTMVGEGM